MDRTEYMNEWKRNNRAKTRLYFKRWYEKKGREHRKKHYLKNREKALAYQAIYREKHPNMSRKKEYITAPISNLLSLSIMKHRARDRVRYALKHGKLTKLPCETCGEIKSQAHHPDYTKPLDVKWLCRKHHSLIHKNDTRIQYNLGMKKSLLSCCVCKQKKPRDEFYRSASRNTGHRSLCKGCDKERAKRRFTKN